MQPHRARRRRSAFRPSDDIVLSALRAARPSQRGQSVIGNRKAYRPASRCRPRCAAGTLSFCASGAVIGDVRRHHVAVLRQRRRHDACPRLLFHEDEAVQKIRAQPAILFVHTRTEKSELACARPDRTGRDRVLLPNALVRRTFRLEETPRRGAEDFVALGERELRRPHSERPMRSFMISLVPPAIRPSRESE